MARSGPEREEGKVSRGGCPGPGPFWGLFLGPDTLWSAGPLAAPQDMARLGVFSSEPSGTQAPEEARP